MSLHERITEDMKAAMRAKESARLSAIRLLLAALKQKQVDERAPGKESAALADADVLGVIEKMLKQRRESIAQFEKAGRTDLAEVEKFEISVLAAYMPQQLGAAEVEQAIAAAIAESGASGVKDMGKVMALLKSRLAGRADMGQVSGLVKAKLSA
jgi:uncharacterized protein YqeY